VTNIMLQNTPPHWNVMKLGQLFTERREKVSDQDFAPLSVTRGGIVPQLENVAKTNDGGNRKKVCIGDFVINSRSDRRGSSGLSELEGSVSLISIVLQPREGHRRFLHYLLKSYAFQEEFYRFGHGIVADLWTTRFSDMRGIPVAIPDLPTQRAIADCLDRETDRIDQMIEKKQRLVELFSERSATILEVTVKGQAHGKSAMRDSGIEWIGAIPEHWTAPKINQVAVLATGHTPSRSEESYWIPEECTIPWFGLQDIWQIRHEGRVYVSTTKEKISPRGLANSAAELLPANTVILSRTASVGFPAIMEVPMTTTQDFVNWVCGPKLRPKYLYYVLRAMRRELNRLMIGSTHQTIYMPDVRAFRTPLPPFLNRTKLFTVWIHY
jgi:type I restriction enzyme, S subunit